MLGHIPAVLHFSNPIQKPLEMEVLPLFSKHFLASHFLFTIQHQTVPKKVYTRKPLSCTSIIVKTKETGLDGPWVLCHSAGVRISILNLMTQAHERLFCLFHVALLLQFSFLSHSLCLYVFDSVSFAVFMPLTLSHSLSLRALRAKLLESNA